MSLEKALEYIGIKNLPKEGGREFTGLAIALVARSNLKQSYVVVRWNDKTKQHDLVKDFNPSYGCITEYLSFHPIKVKEPKKEFNFEELSFADMKKYLNKNNIPYLSNSKEGFIEAYNRSKEKR